MIETTEPRLTGIAGLEHLVSKRDQPAVLEAERIKRAVSYVRVSNPKQLRTAMDVDSDGNSLATQREHAKRAAVERSAEIVKEFVERGRSAQTIAERPSFRALLAYVEENAADIDYLIVYARSRAFRNYEDAPEVEGRLRRLGIEVVSATENFGEDKDMAAMFKFFTDVMNTKQVKDNGRDISTKMLHKAQRGGFNGRAKLGYLNDKVKVEGYFVSTIVVDPERAPLIKWAFEAYATADYSLPKLQRELTDLGLTTRQTAAFKSQPVSLSQLAKILRDPHYTGVILYNGDLYPGRHEPLISKELFLRVQDVMSGRVRRGLRDRVHHHYLRGLLLCQRCHDQGLTSQLVYTEAVGNGGTYEYFFCPRKKRVGGCDLPYVPVHEAERAVAKRFGRERLSAGTIAELRQELDGAMVARGAAEVELQRSLRHQLKRLEGQEDRLVDLVADGALPVSKLKARLRGVVLQREHLLERLGRTDEELARGTEMIDLYLEMLAEPESLFNEATDSVRRQLLEALFPPFMTDMNDEITLSADAHPAVRALSSLESQISVGNEKSPRLSAGAQLLINLADLFFRPNGSNKGSLVAGTGFEPATSGL